MHVNNIKILQHTNVYFKQNNYLRFRESNDYDFREANCVKHFVGGEYKPSLVRLLNSDVF